MCCRRDRFERGVKTMTQDARIQQMLEQLPVEELDPEDIEFLRWIAGWGDSTTDKLIRIIRKCRENPFRKRR